jgi:hypothetical protein
MSFALVMMSSSGCPKLPNVGETPVRREERAVEIRPTITKQRPVLSGTATRLEVEGVKQNRLARGIALLHLGSPLIGNE